MSQTTTSVSPEALSAAADRLRTADRTGVPGAPVRDLIGRDDVAAAYAVQQQLTDERVAAGARVVGRKIGLTSAAVQAQLGVDQPDFGVLFDDMAYADGDTVPAGSVLQPRVEAEVAFVLGADLAEGPLDHEQVRGAIASAVAALEICGSRVADWDISFGDTVADNASAGAYVLGADPRTLDQVEPREVTMSMSINDEVVSTGAGEACLGDPIEAVVWLARQAREFGEPLRAGQVVLSGALGPMRPVAPGDRVTATITGLGAVSAVFSE
ncbi:2-keto-4-pentenoate hydratase [Nocardioides marmotae]|uniref:2-keto-4-pentenoate hydratase n=1 Tax=Nocardioides marmotae TaxID=2663857 RepID=A0A6I3JE75_9ACTN|nr:fumarylacetoacetate hydrolase family protein [Nocardioides marmotae]MCR6032866.1 2-keto-4-pentenoate hydratase [Gordonia jinghuaiqii]MBC9735215.1 fumarylacetoacetate hydrolase family protein [Nocardioides marmotae]MTB86315.1 2-keto-4-pentenoate hydratase [Nocardioides marmotae]MTB96516.1 2-keto-4-pentenoate hydratase [Nocardioides marmotae]QKE01963.1 2-keto-4-pentenoate hydratase [Nocardioides marmotae]